jgi:G:T-mismatch repair DNA endonuclease (very short patch repair protein)
VPDQFDQQKRSDIMAKVLSTDTRPEIRGISTKRGSGAEVFKGIVSRYKENGPKVRGDYLLER